MPATVPAALEDDIHAAVLALRAIGARLPDDMPEDRTTLELEPMLQNLSEVQFLATDLITSFGAAYQSANVRELQAATDSEGE